MPCLDFHHRNFLHHNFLHRYFLHNSLQSILLSGQVAGCPPAPILTQLPEYDDELASLLSDSYISELSGVTDDCLLSGAVESSSVMAPQEAQRQSLLPSTSQPSASDAQLSALLAGGGCPPQLTNTDVLPHPRPQTGRWWMPPTTDQG